MSESTDHQLDPAKEVEFYAASVNAWYMTSLEHDKSLLVLSAGGIGVLVTLLTTKGVDSLLGVVLYVSSLLGFLVALVLLLVIFKKNGDHIHLILSKADKVDNFLALLDRGAAWSFGIGAVFLVLLGIATTVEQYQAKRDVRVRECDMAEQKQPKGSMTFDSVQGVKKLLPESISKSFNGAGSLQPKAAAQQTPASSTPSAASSTSAPTIPSGSAVPPASTAKHK